MYSNLFKELSIDCQKCSGLCCVALYYSKTDGFPEDKPANVPCKHLEPHFKCAIHSQLFEKNLKGCLIYECFGAGQKVTQMYTGIGNWSTSPTLRKEIYEVFLTIRELHQMCWYLIQGLNMNTSSEVNKEITLLIEENRQIAHQEPHKLLKYDLYDYRTRTNNILHLLTEKNAKSSSKSPKSFFGKNFRGKNLDGENFSMSYLIASNLEGCSLKGTNFLGADMRDAIVKNTDLSKSLFLTQMQINSTKGNSTTKLPFYLSPPASWI